MQGHGFESALDRIRQRFVATLPAQRAALAGPLSARGAALAQARQEAIEAAHRISGTAETLGFADLGDAARSCELTLCETPPGAKKARPAEIDALRNVIVSADIVLHDFG
ncbi:hypothetical protein AVJ23_13385 [Pseudoponticoccus marisrubri]|uniref:HPt domain-containing protein n=2 Tax=Pseudoponticoccus marisrubri TaxID=1685382 RepID=A0A0W7WIM4_9RHOB|nr:hypothetical protein AVJ23_13385 [Pseudoponticoccus marisrubri]